MNVSMSINGNGFSGLAKWFLFVRAYILGWLVPCAVHTLSNASNIARISTCERAITQIYRVFVWACERAHRTRSCENDAMYVCVVLKAFTLHVPRSIYCSTAFHSEILIENIMFWVILFGIFWISALCYLSWEIFCNNEYISMRFECTLQSTEYCIRSVNIFRSCLDVFFVVFVCMD